MTTTAIAHIVLTEAPAEIVIMTPADTHTGSAEEIARYPYVKDAVVSDLARHGWTVLDLGYIESTDTGYLLPVQSA